MRGRSIQMVESRTGAVAWGHWPSPRFPSPLVELDVPISGIQLSDWLHRKTHDGAVSGRRSRRSRLSIDNVAGEPDCAAPCHLVPSGEEVTHALVDVSVDGPECRTACSIAEVIRPAEQRPVQRAAHFGPWIV